MSRSAVLSVLMSLTFGASSAAAVEPSSSTTALQIAPTPRVLRVCADPNSLPYSNARGEGFENQLAQLVAKDLGLTLQYFWWAQRRGFFRNGLLAGRCDVVMGIVSGFELTLTTRPYYRSSYVVVQRGGTPPIRSLDDPALREHRIGVQLIGDDGTNPPPAHALGRRGIVDNVVGFLVYGDYTSEAPQRPIISAVEDGAVDLAIVWGPLAGYYAKRTRVPLDLHPLTPQADGDLALTFSVCLGVRRDDQALKARLDRVLARRQRTIDALLDSYGVPRLPLAEVP
jgi:mxaJ protein